MPLPATSCGRGRLFARDDKTPLGCQRQYLSLPVTQARGSSQNTTLFVTAHAT